MKNKKMCYMPWAGVSNNPDGTVRPCCLFKDTIKDENGKDMYVQNHTLKELFATKYMKDVRQKFREGIEIPECSTCWDDEKHGRKSKRQIFKNEVWPDLGVGELNTDEEPTTPFDYQLIISNSCNLKCRSCTPSHSSQWQLEHEKYHIDNGYPMPHGQAGTEESVLWKDRFEWYKTVKRIEVVGGEPMYIKQWHKIFDELIELDYAKDIVLDMSTNANIFLEDKVRKWIENFKRVGIGLSIDGMGPTYDYMRHLGKWDKVFENMDKYHELAVEYDGSHFDKIEFIDGEYYHDMKNHQFSCQISFTLSWLNALELPKMIELVEHRYPHFKIWMNLVHYPDWMRLNVIPPEMKQFIENRWLYDDKGNVRDLGKHKQDILGYIDFMNQPHVTEETFKYFLAKNIFLDNWRGEDLFATIPEYEVFLNKYITEPTEAYSVINTIPIVEVGSVREEDPFIYD